MAADDRTFTPVVAANGTAVATIKVANGIDTWIITQISAELPAAPIGATGEVRKNTYLVSPFIPTGDTVAGEPPVYLRPTDVLTVQWAGCTPGQVAKVLVFFDDGRGPS